MFSKNHIINVISLIAILYTCLLILNSNSNISFFYSLIFLAASISFLFLLSKFDLSKRSSVNSKLRLLLIISLFLVTTMLLVFVPQSTHKLLLESYDGWLSNFFSGSYPYQPEQVYMGFPLLYLTGLLFHLAGQTILIAALGVGTILFFIYKTSKFNNEFFVRVFFISTLIFLCFIFNINLIPFFIIAFPLLIIYLIENNKLTINSNYSIAVFGMIAGLFLSVHLVSSAIIIFYLFFFLRQDIYSMLKVFSISIVIFILTLLPFAIWNWENFSNFNPLIGQFELLNISTLLIILIGLFAIIAGWMISNTQEFYFTAGLLLFIVAVYNFSNDSNYFSKSIFLYSTVFLILSIKHYKVDRFLGKVLK